MVASFGAFTSLCSSGIILATSNPYPEIFFMPNNYMDENGYVLHKYVSFKAEGNVVT